MPPDPRRRAPIARGGWRWREPTDPEFRAFAALVQEASGIALNDSKRALVARRLNARLQTLGIERLRDYVKLVREDDSGAECVRLLDLIATNETHFFRERAHFDFLESRVFPEWIAEANAGKRPRVIRAWSAACSTGQEPFSLAMLLLGTFAAEQGWRIEIEATDIDTRALDTANNAEWPVDKAQEIPRRYLQRFMLRGTGPNEGSMRASRELRQVVRFSRVNLNEKYYAVPGSFDVIFCRNVLIYFSPARRAEVIERLADRLTAGGLLFVGHAESLHAHRARLRAVLPTVYVRAA